MKWKVILLMFVLWISFLSEAKEWVCTKYQKIPIIMQGCEGEMCGRLMYNKVVRSTSIYEKPSLNSKVIDRLEKCERIRDFKPYLVIKKLGNAEVLHTDNELQLLGVKIGDKIPFIRLMDEDDVIGELLACIQNKETFVYDVMIAESDEEAYAPFSIVKVLTQNVAEEWIQLKTPRNKIGYTLDNGFYDGFYTYDDADLCPGDKPKTNYVK